MKSLYLVFITFVMSLVVTVFFIELSRKISKNIARFSHFIEAIVLLFWLYISPTVLGSVGLWFSTAMLLMFSALLFIPTFLAVLFHVTTAPIRQNNLPNLIIYMCFSWIALYIAASSINYALYILAPWQFSISDKITVSETALATEFLYYTFTLMVTYSGADTITATGGIAKAFQVAEIVMFYIFLGIFINTFLGRASEPDNESQSHGKPPRRRRNARRYVKRNK